MAVDLQRRFDLRVLHPQHGAFRLNGQLLHIDSNYLLNAFPALATDTHRGPGYDDLYHICMSQSLFNRPGRNHFSQAIRAALSLAVHSLEVSYINRVPFTTVLVRRLQERWERERIIRSRALRTRTSYMFPETLHLFIGLAEVARVFSAMKVAEALVMFFIDCAGYFAQVETQAGLLVWGAALCLSGAVTAQVAQCARRVAPFLPDYPAPLQLRALNSYATKFSSLARQYPHTGSIQALNLEQNRPFNFGLGLRYDLLSPNHLRGGGLGLGPQYPHYLDLDIGPGSGMNRVGGQGLGVAGAVVENLEELNHNIYGLREEIQHASARRPTMMPRAMSQPAFHVYDEDSGYMSDEGWP